MLRVVLQPVCAHGLLRSRLHSKNRIVSMGVIVQIVRLRNKFNIHDGLYRVHNSILYYLRAVAYNQQYITVHTRWRVPGTRHTVYNSIFNYPPAIVYKLYKRIHAKWCVTSVRCIRSTRSTFLNSVQHTITACKQYTLHSLSGASFSYRNSTPHLYEFVLLRFVKWVLRAYKYWQLRP